MAWPPPPPLLPAPDAACLEAFLGAGALLAWLLVSLGDSGLVELVLCKQHGKKSISATDTEF